MNKRSALVLIGICAVYLLTRSYQLDRIPVFMDEAIHIELSQNADSDRARSFGKWLAVKAYTAWLSATSVRLVDARALIVLVGLGTLIGLYLLGNRLFERTEAGLSAALAYLCWPYALFYDRVALTDPFLTLCVPWLILATIAYIKSGKPIVLISTWLILAAAVLFKTSGLVLMGIPIIYGLCLHLDLAWATRFKRLGILILGGLIVAVPLALYTAPRHETSKLSSAGTLRDMVLLAKKNLTDAFHLHSNLLHLLFIALLILGLIIAITKGNANTRRRVIAHTITWGLLVAPYLLLAKQWFPRYLLPALVPLALLTAEAALAYVRLLPPFKLRSVAVLAALLIAPVYSSARMLANPSTYPFYWLIDWQWYTGWPSGVELDRVIEAVNREAAKHPNQELRLLTAPSWDVTNIGLKSQHHLLANNVKHRQLGQWSEDGIVASIEAQLADGQPTLLLYNAAAPLPNDAEVIACIRSTIPLERFAYFEKPEKNPGFFLLFLKPTN